MYSHIIISSTIYRFLKDIRRLNVAVTRAKRGLVIVGNAHCLQSHPTWRSFLEYLSSKKAIVSAASLASHLASGVAMPEYMLRDE
jgi:superfamily I DNA and/or RNA helicase